MRYFQNCLIILLFSLFAFPYSASAQDNLVNELHFEVNRNHPPITITKEKLREAKSLIDLNKRYTASWVKEYKSVEISTTYQGKKRKAVSKNDILSQEQKVHMESADLGTGISVKVCYLPDNTLKHNDVKEIDFTFTVDPEIEAEYCGGKDQLIQYLKESAIDKIPEGSFKNFDLATVKFTIDEEGRIIEPHVFWPFDDEKIDDLLLETISKMPNWKPAEYYNGKRVKQDFVLTVGNMENCVINLLNIDGHGVLNKEMNDD